MPVVGSDNALIKIIDQQERSPVVSYNVYWYRSTVDPDAVDIGEVLDQFEADVLVDLADLQSSGWTHTVISGDVVNGSLAPLVRTSGVGAGAVSGSSMPTYSSFPCRLLRTLKDTRNGSKRIPGVNEEMVVGDGFDATTISNWEAWVPILATPLVDSLANTWTPVIVRTTILGEPIEDPADYVFNPIAEAIFQNRVTTQNSRKLWD